MRKLLLLSLILCVTGFVSAQENVSMKEGKITKKNVKSTQDDDIYLLDSILIYNLTYDAFTEKSYFYYNEDNLEESEVFINIDIWSGNKETLIAMDSSFYDANHNLVLNKLFRLNDDGEVVLTSYTVYNVDENSRLNGYERFDYNTNFEEWELAYKEVYTFDSQNNMTEKSTYAIRTIDLVPQRRYDYSDFVAENKPEKCEIYYYDNNGENPSHDFTDYFEYDSNYRVIMMIEKGIKENGIESNVMKQEWTYNDLGQETEYLAYYVNSGEIEFYLDRRRQSIYDENNNLQKEIYAQFRNDEWNFTEEDRYFWSIPGEEPPVSIKPIEELANVYASYNPQSKQILIHTEEALTDVQLYNINGSIIINQRFSSDYNFEYIIPVNLQAGFYLVKINAEGKSTTQKILANE